MNLCVDLFGMLLCVIDIEFGLCGGIEFLNVCYCGDDVKVVNVYNNV